MITKPLGVAKSTPSKGRRVHPARGEGQRGSRRLEKRRALPPLLGCRVPHAIQCYCEGSEPVGELISRRRRWPRGVAIITMSNHHHTPLHNHHCQPPSYIMHVCVSLMFVCLGFIVFCLCVRGYTPHQHAHNQISDETTTPGKKTRTPMQWPIIRKMRHANRKMEG